MYTFKSEFVVEIWDRDNGYYPDVAEDDLIIDNVTLPIFSSLNMFDYSNPLTVTGSYGIGNLKLNYGNLTMEPTSCSSATQPTFTTTFYIPEGYF